MSENKKPTGSIRCHFSAPVCDEQIIAWIKNQQNLSLSIRVLLKDCITRYGIGDVLNQPIMFGSFETNSVQPNEHIRVEISDTHSVKSVNDKVDNVETSVQEVKSVVKNDSAADMLADMMK